LLVGQQVDQLISRGWGGEVTEVEIAGGNGADPALQVAAAYGDRPGWWITAGK
jgi:hypothetical protein